MIGSNKNVSPCKRATELMQQLELLDSELYGMAEVPEELAWYNHLGTELAGEWIDSPSQIAHNDRERSIIRKQRAILAEIRHVLGVKEELQLHREEAYKDKLKEDYRWAKRFGLPDAQIAEILGEQTRFIMRLGAKIRAAR